MITPGTIIDKKYQIMQTLGEGGMGIVYKAVDLMLEREVALKSLHSHLTTDASKLERFRSEAKTLANLIHPNIAIVYSFFEHAETYYMAMEYVDGETFESLFARLGRLPLRKTLELFCDSLMGFSYAHSKKVIHRDIKPSNIMLNTSGQVKITDFGIARVLGKARLTQAGKLIGTLEYMSPEQIQGGEQDERSDIYSLGVLLYEMVTGRVPFTSTSDFELMKFHLEMLPPEPKAFASDLPREVVEAIFKALEKEPEKRFQHVTEFQAALTPIIQTLPTAEAVQPVIKATREGAVITSGATDQPKPTTVQNAPESPKATRLEQSQPKPTTIGRAYEEASKKPLPVKLIGGIAGAIVLVLALVFALNGANKSADNNNIDPPKNPPVQASQTDSGTATTGGGSSASGSNPLPKQSETEVKIEREVKQIPFKTITEKSASLPLNQKRIKQKGQNGRVETVYKVTYKNGQVVSKEQVGAPATIEPVNEIVLVGSKKAEAPKEPKAGLKFCTKCGARRVPGLKFCPECGARY